MKNKSKFHAHLISEYDRRKKLNPRYSLRAYSKALNISSSLLSRIIKGTIPLTEKMLNRFCVPLKLSPELYKEFAEELSELSKKRKVTFIDEQEISSFAMEEFKIIQDWYHSVIMELTTLDDFQPSPRWISEKIGISKEDAQLAIERLIALNKLELRDDQLVPTNQHYTSINYNFTTVALKTRMSQVFEHASNALAITDISERDSSSITIVADTDLMPEIKEKIKAFRRSLANYIEKKGKKKNSVYELTISFFPWTK